MPERSAKQGPLENNRNSFSWRRAPYRSASASSSLEMCSRVGCGDRSHWRREVEGMKTIQLVSPQADLCGCAGKLAYCGPFELIILLFHKLRAELRVFFVFGFLKLLLFVNRCFALQCHDINTELESQLCFLLGVSSWASRIAFLVSYVFFLLRSETMMAASLSCYKIK